MRWRKHCLDRPLALQRDSISLSRSFQLSLELLVPAVVVPCPPQFNLKPHRVPGVWPCWDPGWLQLPPGPGVGTRGVRGAQPPRGGAANAAPNSQHGASSRSQYQARDQRRRNKECGDHRLQSPNEELSWGTRLAGFFLPKYSEVETNPELFFCFVQKFSFCF